MTVQSIWTEPAHPLQEGRDFRPTTFVARTLFRCVPFSGHRRKYIFPALRLERLVTKRGVYYFLCRSSVVNEQWPSRQRGQPMSFKKKAALKRPTAQAFARLSVPILGTLIDKHRSEEYSRGEIPCQIRTFPAYAGISCGYPICTICSKRP